jgi:hypothetical protein
VPAARRTFWAWVALGVLLVALGSAALASAYARDEGEGLADPSYGDYGVIDLGCSSIFSSCESFDPTPWYAAGGALIFVAAVPFLIAARRT